MTDPRTSAADGSALRTARTPHDASPTPGGSAPGVGPTPPEVPAAPVIYPRQHPQSIPTGNNEEPARLIGSPSPRLFSAPLRELSRETSRGYAFIDFCEMFGFPLLPWQRWLAIHALEILPSGEYRYKTVLVLVARQNGKTHFLKLLTLWRLFVDGAEVVLGSAQTVTLAEEVWEACIDLIRQVPEMSEMLPEENVKKTNGNKQFKLTTGARYKISATNRGSGRGQSVDQLNMDELREQRKWDGWSALSKTTMARPNAQNWAITNAGDHESVVLNSLRERALADLDVQLGIFEWSAPDGCELDDEEAWCAANPALGHTISEQAIRSALATDPAPIFRTEVLCQRVDALDAAIDGGAWDDCQDAQGTLAGVKERVIACVDVSLDGYHVTLAGAAVLDDGRVRVEILKAWDSTDAARRDLPGIVERNSFAAVAWFPAGPSAALAADIRKLKCEVVEIKGEAMSETCQEFADLVLARRVVHPGDQLLSGHVAGSKRLRRGDGWVLTRRGNGQVDAAYAAAGAVHVARTLPAPKPKQRLGLAV